MPGFRLETKSQAQARRRRTGGRRPRRKAKRKTVITKLLKNKTTAKLRYVDEIALNPGLSGITNHVYRANSVFDPNFSGIGHQPLMFDEYALLYENYRVISSTISITPVPIDAQNQIPATYGVYRDPDTTLSYPEGSAIIEDMRNKGGWAFTGFSQYNGPLNSLTRRTGFNAKRDMSPLGANNSVSVTGNPGTGELDYYFQIWASSWFGNDPGAIHFMVQVDYIVEFTDPKHVIQS